MAHHRGDDLEDDFMPDETVAFSEDEGSVSLVGDQDDIGKLLSADEEEEGAESPMEQTKGLLDEKKRRRREKEKERKAKACPFQLTAGLISLMFLTRDALLQPTEEKTQRNYGIRGSLFCSVAVARHDIRIFVHHAGKIIFENVRVGASGQTYSRYVRPRRFLRGHLWLTLSGRELHSGHDCMDGIEELGHVGRFYCSR